MFFSKKKIKAEGSGEIKSIPYIEPSCVQALEELGVVSVSDLKGRDAENMYYEISAKRGEVQDKSLLFELRCAIYYATVKKADPKKLHWWYWRDAPSSEDALSVEELVEMYNQNGDE